jgi:hypothetical protein
MASASKQALVGRVTPCAPLPIPKGGAEDCPPTINAIECA